MPAAAIPSAPVVCVFAGSARSLPVAHVALARRLGRHLADAGSLLVYGGGSTGLMGALADGALDAGGRVVGVIPRGLFAREEVHQGVDVVEVESLHDRKQAMLEMAEAFAVLPGGFGTLDEVSEVLTWAQLGIHDKALVFVGDDGYWDPLFAWVETAIAEGYLAPTSRGFLTVVRDPEAVLPAIALYHAPPATRFLAPDQT